MFEEVFWAIRAEYSADRYLGVLTDVEEHWARTIPQIRATFGVSDTITHDLKNHSNRVYLDEYVKVLRWMQSLVAEGDREELASLVSDLIAGSTPLPVKEKKPRRKKKSDNENQSDTEKKSDNEK